MGSIAINVVFRGAYSVIFMLLFDWQRLREWRLWRAFTDILLLPLNTRAGNDPNSQEVTWTDTQTDINLVTLSLPLPCRMCRASTNTARSTPPPPWRIWQRQSSREKKSWRRGSRWGWPYSWLVHTACTVHQSSPGRKKHSNVLKVSVFISFYTVSLFRSRLRIFLFHNAESQNQPTVNEAVEIAEADLSLPAKWLSSCRCSINHFLLAAWTIHYWHDTAAVCVSDRWWVTRPHFNFATRIRTCGLIKSVIMDDGSWQTLSLPNSD